MIYLIDFNNNDNNNKSTLYFEKNTIILEYLKIIKGFNTYIAYKPFRLTPMLLDIYVCFIFLVTVHSLCIAFL